MRRWIAIALLLGACDDNPPAPPPPPPADSGAARDTGVVDMDAEIERLKGLGADLMEGPIEVPGGPRIAFIKAPDDVRIEIMQLS